MPSFLCVWPSYLNYLSVICFLASPVLAQSSLLEIIFGQNTPRICLRHLFIKTCRVFSNLAVQNHVSESYKSTDFTFELEELKLSFKPVLCGPPYFLKLGKGWNSFADYCFNVIYSSTSRCNLATELTRLFLKNGRYIKPKPCIFGHGIEKSPRS